MNTNTDANSACELLVVWAGAVSFVGVSVVAIGCVYMYLRGRATSNDVPRLEGGAVLLLQLLWV